jgi:formate hydrogenlyase subunit 4
MSGAARQTIQIALAFLLSPLAFGVINKTKAFFAGRRGRPLLQNYYDIAKLLGKSAVYGRTASWVFRAGPVVGLACAASALCLLPWAGADALLGFEGDVILFAGLFGLSRFFTITAALDTGSAFEGMGASREAWFSALIEPAFLLALVPLSMRAGNLSLSAMLSGPGGPVQAFPALFLSAAAVFVVFLAENARIPVDDPETHLELTMIHEAMILDHGGVDLAFIHYGAALKMWAFGSLFAGLLAPRTGDWISDAAVALAVMACLWVAVGTVESIMARLRLSKVPQLLVAAAAMSALALTLVLAR